MPFEEILVTIENSDMKEFAENLIEVVPAYFFEVPASSTGKYHPEYALGQGGLYRHTLAVVKFVNYFFEVKYIANRWTSRQRDIVRIAAIMHDTFKSGSQFDYEQDPRTKHEHPLIASQHVLGFAGRGLIPDSEIEQIASIISSHMGQWITSDKSNIVLPEPVDDIQQLLHLADYLASRKDIEVHF